jgi:hypothetical protein
MVAVFLFQQFNTATEFNQLFSVGFVVHVAFAVLNPFLQTFDLLAGRLCHSSSSINSGIDRFD